MSALQFVHETPKQRAKHREIEIRYRRKRGNRRPARDYVRVRDLERLFIDRWGNTLPDDDAGAEDVRTMAHHLAFFHNPEMRIKVWLQRWAPWYTEAGADWLIASVTRRPRKWSADALGKHLGINDATRTRLGLTTIGAIDFKKAKRARRRQKLAAARERARRLKAGARPHAKSLSKTRPWEALGISRRTYERRRRIDASDANSCAAYPSDIVQNTKLRHGVPERPPGAPLWHALRPLNDGFPMLPREPKFFVLTASLANIPNGETCKHT